MRQQTQSCLLRRGHWVELFSPGQQARPCPCPELDTSVWAASDQPGKVFLLCELGSTEPQFLRSLKGRAGRRSQFSCGSPPRAVLGSARAGDLWVAGFGSTQERARLTQEDMSCPCLEMSMEGLITEAGGPIREGEEGRVV